MKLSAAVLGMIKFTMVEGEGAIFPASCPNVTVLHGKSEDGWLDACLGLKEDVKAEKAGATTAEGCKKACYEDMFCSVWQFIKHSDMTGKPEKCWTGSVFH